MMWIWLVACPGNEPQKNVDTSEPSTSPPDCEAGEILDGDTCIPEACGVGTWGNLPVDEDTIYVEEGGTGDGSEESPFGSIREALDLAAERGTELVAVAAGTYFEVVDMGKKHDRLTLAGRCKELVTIDGSGGEEVPAIEIVGGQSRPEIWISGVMVTAGTAVGLWVEEAAVTVTRADFRANVSGGIVAFAAGLTLQNVGVYDTVPDSLGAYGRGIEAGFGTVLTATSCRVVGNVESGVFASGTGTTLEIADSVVQATRPSPDDTGGRGIGVQDGATLAATRCTLQGNTDAGLYASGQGTTVDIVDTSVLDTAPTPDGLGGAGIIVKSGADFTALRGTIQGNTDVGLFAGGLGTTVGLTDATVLDTAPRSDGMGGRGIEVEDSAILTATGTTVERSTELGISASGVATSVTLASTNILDTAPSPDGTGGRGLHAQEGAMVTITGATLAGNTEVGVFASGSGTRVDLIDAVVVDTTPGDAGGAGIAVQSGAALTASGCTVQANSEIGVLALGAGTSVDLTGTAVLDTTTNSDGHFGNGIHVEDGATLRALDCTIQENTGVGVQAGGEGTTVDLTGTSVFDTRRNRIAGFAIGVMAQKGARLSGNTIEIGRTEGPGVYAVAGATVDLDTCSLTSNTFAGALVLDAAAGLDALTITGTLPDDEWGGGFGVYASNYGGPGSLTLTNSTIGHHPYAAVWLDGDGAYVIEDNDLSGNEPYDLRGTPIHGNAVFAERGVTAWDGDSGLRLAGNHVHGSSDVAVLLDGSTAELENNTWADNGTDVWQQRCAHTTQLVDPDPDWVVCTGGNLLTDLSLQFTSLYLPDADPL